MKKTLMLSLSLLMFLSLTIVSCNQTSKQETSTADSEATEAETETTETSEEPESESKAVASPRKQASGEIDGVAVNVDYGSPSVKGREIWGGLEAYGKVWRAGANETTAIEFDKDVTINGNALAAGKYAFFIIPNENEDWVAIFNEEWSREEHEAWGAYNYKEDKDVLRVNVKPEWSDEVQEALEYNVANGTINFAWEKARITLEVKAG
ncbi:DUF2911 domain-containing protein [Fulvivirgaceae bacterium BMA10]|uniref:DUF2911 domain-containing protein n=1 Tax=Splendidivirga corallicola TaxID=3051826 RepID=A0ABT8KLW8_9BACT|nr:DUF2911 domain-containing protein [Fulvivirgaceae bacterium BMA10]